MTLLGTIIDDKSHKILFRLAQIGKRRAQMVHAKIRCAEHTLPLRYAALCKFTYAVLKIFFFFFFIPQAVGSRRKSSSNNGVTNFDPFA